MNAIIKREYFIFKHNLITYLFLWILIPMTIYLVISIPLSFYINLSNGINYLNWSSVGNWISTSCLFTFIVSINIINRYRKSVSYSKTMLSTPISNKDHLLGVVAWSSMIGIIQLFFSLVITLSLKSGNLFFIDLLLAVIYIVPIILFTSNLGILISLICQELFIQRIVAIILFLLLFFSTGLFFPLSSGLPLIFHLSPLYISVLNIQAIMTNDPSMIYSSLILLSITILLFIINLIASFKVFRSQI